MTLHFTLTENDVLAFTKRYLHDSKSFQATRTRVRWTLPAMLTAMACYYTWRDGLSWIIPVIFGIAGAVWYYFYPRLFDARVLARTKRQMDESASAKMLGAYELQLLDDHLSSTSALGSSTLNWAGVDRVTMDSDYLIIFLAGSRGYPIRISEIGQDTAQQAHDFVAERIRLARQ